MPLGTNVLHSIEFQKNVWAQKNPRWPPRIQDGQHENQFLSICSSGVNICDKLKEQKIFITFTF